MTHTFFQIVENVYINCVENNVEKFLVLKMLTLAMLKTVLKIFMQGKFERYVPFFERILYNFQEAFIFILL